MLIRIVTTTLILISGILTGLSQAPAPDRAWTISLPMGQLVTSGLNVTNKCRNESKIKLESKDLKFLVVPDQPLNVAGESTVAVSLQFDTRSLKPGIYSGTLSIACVNCGGESGCPVQREARKVELTVTAALGRTQSTADPAFDPKPIVNGDALASFNRTTPPTIVALRAFLKGPCPERERDCDSLRRRAEALAEEARALSAKAAELRASAASARKTADAIAANDNSQSAVEVRQKASSAEFASASALTAAAKATETSEAALSEYKKCLLKIEDECRKKD